MPRRFPKPLVVALVALAAPLIAAPVASAQGSSPDGLVLATIKDDNDLVTFARERPHRTVQITSGGEPVTERFLGIDVRPTGPRAGILYGITNTGKIYSISPRTGAATLQSTSSIVPVGNSFGVDFNPVVDRLRVTSDADQNLRINVGDGTATNDTPIQYQAGDPNAGRNPAATGAGYTFAPLSSETPPDRPTTLFDIDAATDDLVIQNPPNNGTLNTQGSLNRNARSRLGFDIAGRFDYKGFALFQTTGAARLESVNLENGGTSGTGIALSGEGYDGLAVLNGY